jgi:putative membrane protein
MVDSRMLQANERTLLDWVRTSISLMTFGFVIAKIGLWLPHVNTHPELHASPQSETAWIGGAFMVLGVCADIIAVTR